MDIISRKAAREAGLNKYYTGIPCKNGHHNMRYVQSGTCQGCINGSNSPIFNSDNPEIIMAHAALKKAQADFEETKRAIRKREYDEQEARKRKAVEFTKAQETNDSMNTSNVEARKEARANMIKARFRVYDSDRDMFATSVWMSSMMRYSVITQADVDPKLLPTDKAAGTGLYAFYCYADDLGALREIAESLLRTHAIDVVSKRLQALVRAAEYLPSYSTPPVNYD